MLFRGVQLEKTILGLKSAKVQKATLLEQINKTTIVTPFHGIVTAKLTEEGAFAAPGIPLLQITDISSLKFTVNVPENELSQFQINQTYSLSADVYPEISLSGKVILIGSKANLGNSFPVQFSVTNTTDLKNKIGDVWKGGSDSYWGEKRKCGKTAHHSGFCNCWEHHPSTGLCGEKWESHSAKHHDHE